MRVSRRHVVTGLVAALAVPLALWRAAGTAKAGIGTCVLWPQLDEGPYYFDPKQVRSDITEGRAGVPLTLTIKVQEFDSCKPLANARVDIWHADAGGIYSGYPGQGDKQNVSTKGQHYLRGTQITGANGEVTFNSIYPGWYPGRTPHIHVKAFLGNKMVVTGQAFFPDTFSARIYHDKAPYSARPVADTTNAADGIFGEGEKNGGGTILAMSEVGAGVEGRLTISVDSTGQAARKAEGWSGYLKRKLTGG
jgi:protocatechuate 3,4-dioxygenase beta subunit